MIPIKKKGMSSLVMIGGKRTYVKVKTIYKYYIKTNSFYITYICSQYRKRKLRKGRKLREKDAYIY